MSARRVRLVRRPPRFSNFEFRISSAAGGFAFRFPPRPEFRISSFEFRFLSLRRVIPRSPRRGLPAAGRDLLLSLHERVPTASPKFQPAKVAQHLQLLPNLVVHVPVVRVESRECAGVGIHIRKLEFPFVQRLNYL